MSEKLQVIEINTEEIKLDQFLKWAGIVNSGGEAKDLIASGIIAVNGQVETKRGRKLKNQDVISIQNKHLLKVISLLRG
jgi:ribosome-associated protein